jgi:hypothetical protein
MPETPSGKFQILLSTHLILLTLTASLFHILVTQHRLLYIYKVSPAWLQKHVKEGMRRAITIDSFFTLSVASSGQS